VNVLLLTIAIRGKYEYEKQLHEVLFLRECAGLPPPSHSLRPLQAVSQEIETLTSYYQGKAIPVATAIDHMCHDKRVVSVELLPSKFEHGRHLPWREAT
jgi:hypothetical protein